MWVRSPPGPLLRSWACRLTGKTVGLHPADEGSTPSTVHCSHLARWWNGRHALLRRPCPPWREGSSPSLVTGSRCPGGERDIMAPSEGAGPGSIPGRGTVVASMVKGRSRGSAKAEFLVRVQVGALWPNSKRQRDPAVNRGCAGSTPAGHPRGPVQLDGTSTPLLKGSVRVRVPPLVLDYPWARPSAGDGGSEPRSSWLDTSTGCS
jgi:hypothetical protein